MSLIPEKVFIWRAPDGDYHIEWQASEHDTRVTVEPITATDTMRAEYSNEPTPRARISGLPLDRRHFFRLRDHLGNEVLATERRLGLEGSPNFRDFGGYATTAGQQVKWGYLFRSGHLAGLTARDLTLMATLNLDLICDFRQTQEQLDEPHRLPVRNPPVVCSLPISPGNNSGFLQNLQQPLDGPEQMFAFMVAVNQELVEAQTVNYSRMFAAILSHENARVLVNCAAGKDRTGFGAAIILLSLGVSEDTVMRDYLLSSQFYDPTMHLENARRKYRLTTSDSAAIRPMLEVNQAYLQAALVAVHKIYGSVDTYLQDALGVGPVELGELRARYLER